jgi:hypothetical protein
MHADSSTHSSVSLRRPPRVTDGLSSRLLRVVVAPLAMAMRASDRLTGFSVEDTHRVRRGGRKLVRKL